MPLVPTHPLLLLQARQGPPLVHQWSNLARSALRARRARQSRQRRQRLPQHP